MPLAGLVLCFEQRSQTASGSNTSVDHNADTATRKRTPMSAEAVLNHHLESFGAGDVAYIVWRSVNEGVEVTLGTDTLVVRDGKIAVQTFAAKIEER